MKRNASQSSELNSKNENPERRTLFSAQINTDQTGNKEFYEWYDKSLPVYGRLSYLKDEICGKENMYDVNVEEAIRRTESITFHKITIKNLVHAFIELKELKNEFPNNNLIDGHYNTWLNCFMCLQTGDVVPFNNIPDKGKTAIIHRIFEGETAEELQKALEELKGSRGASENKKQRKYGGTYMRLDTSGKQIKSKKIKSKQIKSKKNKRKQIKSKQIKSKKNKRKQIKSKQIKSKKNKGLQIKNKQSKKNKKNFK